MKNNSFFLATDPFAKTTSLATDLQPKFIAAGLIIAGLAVVITGIAYMAVGEEGKRKIKGRWWQIAIGVGVMELGVGAIAWLVSFIGN